MKKSWKTTLFGALALIGEALQASEHTVLKAVGQIVGAVALLLLGAAAKDYNVSGQ